MSRNLPNTFLDYIPETSERVKNHREILENSFEKDCTEIPPIYTLLKVTERCISNCVYCAHAGIKYAPNEASTEDLERVLAQIAEAGAASVSFTGGEPLLRADIMRLSHKARSLGLFTVLHTNGVLLSRRISELRESAFDMVIVSVDSIDKKNYKATRGIDVDVVLDGIEGLRKLGPQAPVITVTTVVTKNNIDDLEKTVEYFNERNIGVELTPYHHHGRWEEDRLSPIDRKNYAETIGRLKSLKKAGAGILNSEAYLDGFEEFVFQKRKLPVSYRCYSGHTTLYIDSQLNLRSCWSNGMPIAGNLRKSRIKDILDSARMQKIRGKIRNLKCEHCWLLCTAEISLRWQD